MKLKIGVIFGGKSLEHEMSIITALQAMEHIDTDKYEIVGTIEADPLANKISNESPLAKAILGHKIGDVVEVEVAKPYKVEIIAIEKN